MRKYRKEENWIPWTHTTWRTLLLLTSYSPGEHRRIKKGNKQKKFSWLHNIRQWTLIKDFRTLQNAAINRLIWTPMQVPAWHFFKKKKKKKEALPPRPIHMFIQTLFDIVRTSHSKWSRAPVLKPATVDSNHNNFCNVKRLSTENLTLISLRSLCFCKVILIHIASIQDKTKDSLHKINISCTKWFLHRLHSTFLPFKNSTNFGETPPFQNHIYWSKNVQRKLLQNILIKTYIIYSIGND